MNAIEKDKISCNKYRYIIKSRNKKVEILAKSKSPNLLKSRSRNLAKSKNLIKV